MQISACHIRSPAYLHSRNTATASSSAADSVTSNQSPPSMTCGRRMPATFPLHPETAVITMQLRCMFSAEAVQLRCRCQSPGNARCAFRRDHRSREAHFTHESVPSLASAPHGHSRPVRQPLR